MFASSSVGARERRLGVLRSDVGKPHAQSSAARLLLLRARRAAGRHRALQACCARLQTYVGRVGVFGSNSQVDRFVKNVYDWSRCFLRATRFRTRPDARTQGEQCGVVPQGANKLSL